MTAVAHHPTGQDGHGEITRRIRHAVLERLTGHPGKDRLSPADQRQLLRAWIEDELGLEARRRVNAGLGQLERDAEQDIVEAVERALWGLGRLQALLDVPGVEDIHIVGCDRPLLRMSDGTLRTAADPIADSDEDLITQVQYIAAHHGATERAFSPSQPCLNMQLPDGSRLAAMRDVSPRPTVTIRRHGFVDVDLDALVRLGMLSSTTARFLQALVRARRSILVTGMPASGKTTLLRALAREIPPTERIATLETEFELGLHRLPGASPMLLALECRPGGAAGGPGPRGPPRGVWGGRGGAAPRGPPGAPRPPGGHAGEVSLADLLHQTLRMSVTRVIVGEVRGDEALPMLEAMNAGMPGSMCTLHAGSASDAFERLVTAALKAAGRGWSDSFVTRLAAQGIDYVVHLRHLDHPALGRRLRFVSEIAEVTDVTETGAVAMNRIVAPTAGTGDPRGVVQMTPQVRWPFDEAGIDLNFLRGVPPPAPAGRRGWS